MAITKKEQRVVDELRSEVRNLKEALVLATQTNVGETRVFAYAMTDRVPVKDTDYIFKLGKDEIRVGLRKDESGFEWLDINSSGCLWINPRAANAAWVVVK